MKIYVQSYTRAHGFYWIEETETGWREIETELPEHSLEECYRFIDPTSPSLLIAAAPEGRSSDWTLLINGVGAAHGTRGLRDKPFSMLLVFDGSEEVRVRALAVALLSSVGDALPESNSFSSEALESISLLIEEGEDVFTVDPSLKSHLEEVIKAQIGNLDDSEVEGALAASNSPRSRQELAQMLRESSLPLPRTSNRPVPIVVVTKLKSPDTLVSSGAKFVLTNSVKHEGWYDLSQSPPVSYQPVERAEEKVAVGPATEPSAKAESTQERISRPERREVARPASREPWYENLPWPINLIIRLIMGR